jgi:Na+/H+ antiporter NhaC
MIDPDHMAFVVFSLLLRGLVGVMARSGGTHGVVDVLEKMATNRTRGQFLTWISAAFIFFDDYANTLIRGNALRPMTDRRRISREKLAYIVDSTAAPLAVSAVVTTWIGFEITQIRDALGSLAARTEDPELAAQLQAGADNAFVIFLHSIPYLFYPILALFFVLMIIVMRRDFGAMYHAERRSYSGGGLIRPGAMPAADPTSENLQPPRDKPHRWYNAVAPVLTVIVVALGALWTTGAAGLGPPGRTLVNVTSGSPEQARAVQRRAREHGAAYLDGGVMGDPPDLGPLSVQSALMGDLVDHRESRLAAARSGISQGYTVRRVGERSHRREAENE